MNEVTAQKPVAPAPIVQFKRDLTALREAGELDMLPSNVSYDAFRNAAVVAITDNPAILQCARESVFKAIRRLAAAGLVPDGREAAIVPFKGQAQAMPMVAGLIKTARNSGEITSIWSDVVYEDEAFRVWVDQGERKFEHDFDPLHRSGEIKGAYAVAKLKDGTIEMEPMSRAEIEKRRKASANQKSDQPTGIWADWYSEMAKKTVIRALCKRLPISSEDMRRLFVEDEASALRDITPKEQAPRPNLAQRLAQAQSDTETPEAALDGEIMPPEPDPAPDGAHWTDDHDVADAFPGSEAFDQGVKAFQAGKQLRDVPYEQGSTEADDWIGGYCQARRAKE